MKISSIGYGLKEGWKNIRKNRWYSVASACTMAACIFLFCMAYAIVANVAYMVERAETTIGVTVFFEDAFHVGVVNHDVTFFLFVFPWYVYILPQIFEIVNTLVSG